MPVCQVHSVFQHGVDLAPHGDLPRIELRGQGGEHARDALGDVGPLQGQVHAAVLQEPDVGHVLRGGGSAGSEAELLFGTDAARRMSDGFVLVKALSGESCGRGALQNLEAIFQEPRV